MTITHKNPDPAAFNDDVLHIHSPWVWHDDAVIVGTRKALEALRNALTRTLDDGMMSTVESFVNDGEGYDLEVRMVSPEAADKLPMPYVDPECFPRKKPDPNDSCPNCGRMRSYACTCEPVAEGVPLVRKGPESCGICYGDCPTPAECGNPQSSQCTQREPK